ncbi:MAG: adenylosuccinate synthetase [Clostridia bacterium]|nr:adenylosuccinate synthetase [Clostridia bacterium]
MDGRAVLTCGMNYGDEGKGSFVDWLAEGGAPVIMKYNGGAQASHTVASPSGTVHRFAQLGSGMFHPDCSTVLCENFTMDPFSLAVECEVFAEKLNLPAQRVLDRVTVHENCLTVTRLHRCINRVELEQLALQRSSVGTGVSTAAAVLAQHGIGLRAGELQTPILRERLMLLQEILEQRLSMGSFTYNPALVEELARVRGRNGLLHMLREYDTLFQTYRIRTVSSLEAFEGRHLVLEGSQGLLLDRKYGILPHTTQLDTTALWGKRAYPKARAVGIVKAFATRHGVGAFPTEDAELSARLDDPNQEIGRYNGRIRFGHFDAVLTRYAQRVNGVDELHVSCLDRLTGLPELKICVGYSFNGEPDEDFDRLFAWEPSKIGVIIREVLSLGSKADLYLSRCTPLYLSLRSWDEDISAAKSLCELPKNCRSYLDELERCTEIPVTAVSVGATRCKKLKR